MTKPNNILCPDCGEENLPFAVRCRNGNCKKVFDGQEGHSVLTSRRPSMSIGASRLLTDAESEAFGSNRQSSFHAMVQSPIAGLPVSEGQDYLVAILTFSSNARVAQAPATAHQILPFSLNPMGLTNEAAGLRLAGEIWQQHAPDRRLSIVLFGDGEPTAGGGLFGSDAKAAVKEADKLKNQGARISTIGFKGSTYDGAHLRELASSPSLNWSAKSGQIGHTFLHATQSVTQFGQRHGAGELVIFLIDESGSMDEGTKKQEVEDAVAQSVEFLCRF